MTTRAVIPTEHELGILTADKPLLAILRPMEPPAPEGTVHFEQAGELGFWMAYGGQFDLPVVESDGMPLRFDAPFAIGDGIAWQEEWQLFDSTRMCHAFQFASTMPESIAQFRNTVAECRPVKVSTLTMNAIETLGFCAAWDKPSPYVQIEKLLRDDWKTNYPDHLFAWAWWIDLKTPKGKPNVHEND